MTTLGQRLDAALAAAQAGFTAALDAWDHPPEVATDVPAADVPPPAADAPSDVAPAETTTAASPGPMVDDVPTAPACVAVASDECVAAPVILAGPDVPYIPPRVSEYGASSPAVTVPVAEPQPLSDEAAALERTILAHVCHYQGRGWADRDAPRPALPSLVGVSESVLAEAAAHLKAQGWTVDVVGIGTDRRMSVAIAPYIPAQVPHLEDDKRPVPRQEAAPEPRVPDDAWVADVLSRRPFREKYGFPSFAPATVDIKGRPAEVVARLRNELRSIGWCSALPLGDPSPTVLVVRHAAQRGCLPWFVRQMCEHVIVTQPSDVDMARVDVHYDTLSEVGGWGRHPITEYLRKRGYRFDDVYERQYPYKLTRQFVRDDGLVDTSATGRAGIWVEDHMALALPAGIPTMGADCYLPAIPDDIRAEVLAELAARGVYVDSEYAGRTSIGVDAPHPLPNATATNHAPIGNA